MTPPPDRPQTYHNTHIDNPPSILHDSGSDVSAEKATFRAKDVPKMTPGRASLVGLMDRYLAALELADVAVAVHAWAPGKWQFTSSQIALAAERLDSQRWLSGQDRS